MLYELYTSLKRQKTIIAFQTGHVYRIFLVIRRKFSFPKHSKNLDPSLKTDLDFWDCFGER